MSKRASHPSDDPALGSVDPAQHPPISFCAEDWAWFLACAKALGIAGAESRKVAIEALYGHLVGVNRWLNLTTLSSPRDYLKFHLLDSLVAERDARLRHLAQGAPCVDLGSGGGYPGLPLALWHGEVPWVLIDARRKKAEFLAAACTLTGNPQASARHLRGDDAAKAPDLRRRCQVVTCRAMGAAEEVLGQAAGLLRKSGHLLLYKGQAFQGPERAAALAACTRLGYRFVNELSLALEPGDPERVLVVYQRIS